MTNLTFKCVEPESPFLLRAGADSLWLESALGPRTSGAEAILLSGGCATMLRSVPSKHFVNPCPGSEGAVEEVCDSAGRGQAQPAGQRQRHHPLPVPRQVGRTTRFPGSESEIKTRIRNCRNFHISFCQKFKKTL